MWRGMVVHGLVRVESVWSKDEAVMVESSGEPFKAPSGHVTCEALGGSEMEKRIIHPVCLS